MSPAAADTGYLEQHGPGSVPSQMERYLTSPVKWGCLFPRVPGWINGDNVLESTLKNTKCNSNGLLTALC